MGFLHAQEEDTLSCKILTIAYNLYLLNNEIDTLYIIKEDVTKDGETCWGNIVFKREHSPGQVSEIDAGHSL